MIDAGTGFVPLVEALAAHPEQEPMPGQDCMVGGVPAVLCAVLERTAVVDPQPLVGGRARKVVRHDQVEIPASLRWQPRRDWRSWNPSASIRGREGRRSGDRTRS